jgi:hypothetical protein
VTDEQTYQIARNYVVGLIQKIVFVDYLPILLGIYFQNIDQYAGFNKTINPAISVEFNTAFKFSTAMMISNMTTKGENTPTRITEPTFNAILTNISKIPAK